MVIWLSGYLVDGYPALLVLLEWSFIPCYSHIHRKYDFWHDFAGKGVLNVLSEVLQKWFLPF